MRGHCASYRHCRTAESPRSLLCPHGLVPCWLARRPSSVRHRGLLVGQEGCRAGSDESRVCRWVSCISCPCQSPQRLTRISPYCSLSQVLHRGRYRHASRRARGHHLVPQSRRERRQASDKPPPCADEWGGELPFPADIAAEGRRQQRQCGCQWTRLCGCTRKRPGGQQGRERGQAEQAGYLTRHDHRLWIGRSHGRTINSPRRQDGQEGRGLHHLVEAATIEGCASFSAMVHPSPAGGCASSSRAGLKNAALRIIAVRRTSGSSAICSQQNHMCHTRHPTSPYDRAIETTARVGRSIIQSSTNQIIPFRIHDPSHDTLHYLQVYPISFCSVQLDHGVFAIAGQPSQTDASIEPTHPSLYIRSTSARSRDRSSPSPSLLFLTMSSVVRMSSRVACNLMDSLTDLDGPSERGRECTSGGTMEAVSVQLCQSCNRVHCASIAIGLADVVHCCFPLRSRVIPLARGRTDSTAGRVRRELAGSWTCFRSITT